MNSSIFPWKTLAIASTGLVILFIGGFLISGNQPVQSKQTANRVYKAATPVVSGDPVLVASVDKDKTPPTKNTPPVAPGKPKPHAKHSKKHVPAAEAIVIAPTADANNSSVAEPLSIMDKVVVDKEEGGTSLSEMVVMGAGAVSDEDAHPKIGWTGYKQYLREKAIAPDGKPGTVKVTFTVNSNGTCTDFNIKKSLNATADQKAIDLIKNGPTWKCSADGLAAEASVNVDFH